MKYNIGKISLTVWSLFQCQCYRYNTNVPVRRRNSNGMPRSKPSWGNKKGRWLQYALGWVWYSLFLWAKVLNKESVFKSGELLFPPIYHSSSGKLWDLRETFKICGGNRGTNNYLCVVSFRSRLPYTLRGTNFENHGEYSWLQLKNGEDGELEEPWEFLLQIEHHILHVSSQHKLFLTASVQCLQITSQSLTSSW